MSHTISDVAKEAGVSISTVSKVLNHSPKISTETIARVNKAIKRLDYIPNARAVNLARGCTKNIVFLSCLEKETAYINPHMFDILCGAQQNLISNGYSLMISGITPTTPLEITVSQIISQKIADGIIIHGSAYIESLEEIIVSTNFPHILIGHPSPTSSLSWVDTNNGLAGEYAAKHMIECGYKHVAFIGSQKTDNISSQRLNGFVGSMYKYGYWTKEALIGYTDSSISDSYQCTLNILTSNPTVDAIVCENNTIAIGVTKALETLRVNIPQEIALLTFDSYPYSQLIEPKPTIIDIDVFDLGWQAASILQHKIKNPSLLMQSYTTLPVLKQGLTTTPIVQKGI